MATHVKCHLEHYLLSFNRSLLYVNRHKRADLWSDFFNVLVVVHIWSFCVCIQWEKQIFSHEAPRRVKTKTWSFLLVVNPAWSEPCPADCFWLDTDTWWWISAAASAEGNGRMKTPFDLSEDVKRFQCPLVIKWAKNKQKKEEDGNTHAGVSPPPPFWIKCEHIVRCL